MKGFEPLKAEPESAVLPLHYIPISKSSVTLRETPFSVNNILQIFLTFATQASFKESYFLLLSQIAKEKFVISEGPMLNHTAF